MVPLEKRFIGLLDFDIQAVEFTVNVQAHQPTAR